MTARRIAVWILMVLLAVEFALAGASKFSPSTGWARMFVAWGFLAWFRVACGATELACAVALLIPRCHRGGGAGGTAVASVPAFAYLPASPRPEGSRRRCRCRGEGDPRTTAPLVGCTADWHSVRASAHARDKWRIRGRRRCARRRG